MNYSMQNAQNVAAQSAQNAPLNQKGAPSNGDLGEILLTVNEMHRVVSELHAIADRAIGMSSEPCDTASTPLPRGIVGEIAEGAASLHSRLCALNSRLMRLA